MDIFNIRDKFNLEANLNDLEHYRVYKPLFNKKYKLQIIRFRRFKFLRNLFPVTIEVFDSRSELIAWLSEHDLEIHQA